MGTHLEMNFFGS